MKSATKHLYLGMVLAAIATFSLLLGCAGGSSTTPPPTTPQNGSLNIVITDDSTQDWSMIGVKILGIALTPQGGGSPVTVYTPPNPVPVTNLVQLNQLGELIANAQVPPGTYTSASLTIAGNPGDVLLTASPDPEPGFAGTPGATVPASQIQIQGTQGSAGNLTVPVNVRFSAPLIVTTGQNNILNLEFNLAHPAFIVAHVPPGGGAVIWAVSLNGPVRQVVVNDITRLLLCHIYGTVTAVSADNSSMTITRVFPVKPPTNPETAITSSQSLQILADATNGTLFFDLDAHTSSVIKSFSSVGGSLVGKFVRVAARYQADGSLVAVRIWASSSFQKVWLNPEGYLLHVDTTNNVITVTNEDGTAIPLQVNGSTQFFFRAPEKPAADATPIGTGTGFLTNLVRGFKVHVSVVDPLANPLVAQTVDIEEADFIGVISAPTQTGFTVTSKFSNASDNYTLTLDYISNSTPNGKDAAGNPINGFKWWNFTFPTVINFGTNAIPNFIAATNGSVNFGGTVPPIQPHGVSYATWNDPANPNGWSIRATILGPSPIPLGTVAANFVSTANGGTFSMVVPNGTNQVVVNVSSTSGSATLVYQVDKTNNIVTISPQDITTSSALSNVAAHLVNGTPVKVFGVPQSDGSIKAYVLFYFTGTMPTS